MKLTKLKALELCYELWNSLAETGKLKHEWSGWKDNGGEYEAYVRCFACEYDGQNEHRFCNIDCILAEVWKVGHCYKTDSPYHDWNRAQTIEDRKKYARIIADGCLEEIKKLKKAR